MDIAFRLLALIGLNFEFSVNIRGEAFSPVTERLVVSGRPRIEEVAELEAVGVTHVVSCLEEDELPRVAFLGTRFRTLNLAVRDGMDQDITPCFPAFFEFASEALESPDSKLLVHCEAGVSRSATLATAWLMKSKAQTFWDAFLQLRARRAGVLPNIGFASQLQHLEGTMLAERARPGGSSSLARYLREVCHAPVEVGLLDEVLERHDEDAPCALRAIFGGEIPRVVQGVRL